MSVSVWRIASDTRDYDTDDLSGKDAEITGGRWNDKGTPVVYTSANRALAALETIVHLNAGGRRSIATSSRLPSPKPTGMRRN